MALSAPSFAQRLNNRVTIAVRVFSDVLALATAFFLSMCLRTDNLSYNSTYHQFVSGCLPSYIAVLAVYIGIFSTFKLYRHAWRFTSFETLLSVICANSLGIVLLYAIPKLLCGKSLPFSTLVIFWMLSIAMVGGFRVFLRLLILIRTYGMKAAQILSRELRPRKVIVLGAKANSAEILEAIHKNSESPRDVLGCLAENDDIQGSSVTDIRILGPLNKLYELLDQKAVDEVLVALPNTRGSEIKQYVMACRKKGIPVKILPRFRGKDFSTSPKPLQDISVEDLLRRPPVCIDYERISASIVGKRILVTGAGGSIGSEICRQLASLDPSELVLLGHGENSIYKIERELRNHFPAAGCKIHTVIASVCDLARINQVFEKYHPQVVFHAAAHKHVPMMETNVLEALQNNVIGTFNVADACGRHNVESLVLISSDKAVYPSNVMGATKWLCEEIILAMGSIYPSVKYVAVRFGNVLGSRGSVVNVFLEQIQNGGPVTVTDPRMTRYFMSIPEAVQLVLEAGAVGQTGDLFLLDGRQPVKIVDLAEDMIRLYGYEPGVDIEIEFIGKRPGEKLQESLTMDNEVLCHAGCNGLIKIERLKASSSEDILSYVSQIRRMVEQGDEVEAKNFIAVLVPKRDTIETVESQETSQAQTTSGL